MLQVINDTVMVATRQGPIEGVPRSGPIEIRARRQPSTWFRGFWPIAALLVVALLVDQIGGGQDVVSRWF